MRALQDVEIIDQADQDGVGWRVGAAGLQQGERVDTSPRFDGLNGGHKMRQEPSKVGVGLVESQPRHSVLRRLGRRKPLLQERGLAEPGRRCDEDQPWPSASVPRSPSMSRARCTSP
jgi:hypothetical protein